MAKLFRSSSLIALLALQLAPQAGTAAQEGGTIVVGDVHGDYDRLVGILRHIGLVDERLGWNGGSTRLVLTGDLIDRGPRSREVLELVMRLRGQAPRQVQVVLGNHEAMNLMGDLRYVPSAEYRSYSTPGSEALRKSRYESYLEFSRARARRLGFEESSPSGDAARDVWMAAHPPGFFERRQAFGPEGTYGRWLRGLDAALLAERVVFVHGGLSEERPFASIQALNEQVRREISAFDRLWRSLSETGVLWPDLTWSEALELVREELTLWEALAALPPERVDPAAFEQRPDSTTLHAMRDLVAYESWAVAAPEGPLWYRGLAVEPEEALAPEVERILDRYTATRVVVGHTPTEDFRIRARFGGRVFVIDSGISAALGGRASALEIRDGRFTALYPGEEPVLLWESPEPGEFAAREGAVAGETLAAEAAYDAFHGLTSERIERFMRSAPIAEIRKLATGITKPSRATLNDGELRHDVAIQSVNLCEDVARPRERIRERVCDSYKYNIAAYELAKLLGLTSIAPSVERKFDGKRSAFTWWIDDVMTFADMKQRKLSPPEGEDWNRQQWTIGVFDELIYNTDRNQGNLLVDPAWRIWMIDHTRAFRTSRGLRKPGLLARMHVEPGLLDALRSLSAETLERCCAAYLTSDERQALLARRDSIVEHFAPTITAP